MPGKLVFGDKSSVAAALRFKRGRLDESLEVVALGQRGRAALERDEAAIEAMRSAARSAVPVVEVTRKKRAKRARINTIAPSDYQGTFRVIYNAIDTYLVNIVGREVRSDFMALLPMAQEDAKEVGDMSLSPFPPFLGQNLAIKSHGGKTFAYLLGNADVAVKVRKEGHAPTLAAAQVQLSAVCLHRLGYKKALAALAEWVEVWAPGAKLQPSRVDLCADTQGWRPTFEDIQRQAFVTPCPRAHFIAEAGEVGYLRFGTGGKEGSRSGAAPIQLVVYDKSEEVRVSDKGWFVPLWSLSGSYRADEAVMRVEARFTREWLKERAIDTQAQLLAMLPALWTEALEWCRYCVPPAAGEDTNRSRLEVRDEWRVLRAVEWSESPEQPLERIDQARPRLERTLAAIGGHMVTLQALFADSMKYDLRGIADLAIPALLKRWEVRGEDFSEKVEYRRLRLGGMSMA